MLRPFSTRIEEEYIDALKRYSKATGIPIQKVINNLIGGALNANSGNSKHSTHNNSDNFISDLHDLQKIL